MPSAGHTPQQGLAKNRPAETEHCKKKKAPPALQHLQGPPPGARAAPEPPKVVGVLAEALGQVREVREVVPQHVAETLLVERLAQVHRLRLVVDELLGGVRVVRAPVEVEEARVVLVFALVLLPAALAAVKLQLLPFVAEEARVVLVLELALLPAALLPTRDHARGTARLWTVTGAHMDMRSQGLLGVGWWMACIGVL